MILWAEGRCDACDACRFAETLFWCEKAVPVFWRYALETVSLSPDLSARDAPLPSQFKAAGAAWLPIPIFGRPYGHAEYSAGTFNIFNGGVKRTWLVSVV